MDLIRLLVTIASMAASRSRGHQIQDTRRSVRTPMQQSVFVSSLMPKLPLVHVIHIALASYYLLPYTIKLPLGILHNIMCETRVRSLEQRRLVLERLAQHLGLHLAFDLIDILAAATMMP